ncbi:MAG: MT-A70 family methyltransferase [Nitrososphaeria archaeon]
MKIQPWDKVLKTLPPLSEKEFAELKESIKKHGLKYPIKVLPDGRIIDGYHRWLILGDAVPYEVIDLPEEQAYELALTLNIARRQLSPEQIKAVYERAKEIAKELVKAGMPQQEVAKTLNVSQQAVSKWAGGTADLRVAVPKSEWERIYERRKNGEPTEKIAADYKVSKRRIEQLVQNYEKMLSIKQKIEELKEKAQSLPQPQRLYNLVVIDPPWPYGTQDKYDPEGNRGVSPYPEMSLDEIKAIRLPLLDDAVVFLWTTSQFLPAAFDVLKAWGLEYWFIITWVKQRFGVGRILRHQAEYVLVAKKGNPRLEPQPDKGDVIFANAREHSEKPQEFYDLVSALCPDCIKLDYFARKRRPGWDAYGTLEGEANEGAAP